jgi:DNA-directed RNA polymerase sigma subunit (sigma70/sigma32)
MENHYPDDPIAVYLGEVGSVKPLARDEETRLFREPAGSGDWDEARQNVARRLMEGHLAQVVSIAQKHSASGVPMLDLIQARTFAKGPVGDFTDYAANCIDDAINKAFG